jgi:hypothetical protein
MTRKAALRDAVIAAATSALIVVAVLAPALLSADLFLSKKYRDVLLLTSALASPVIDAVMLPFHSQNLALLAAAVVTWVSNATALFALLQVGRFLLQSARSAAKQANRDS